MPLGKGLPLLGPGRRVLLGRLLGSEDVAAMGSGGHRLPGAGGAEAALADVVESRLVGVGASLGRSGGVEIVLGGHRVFLFSNADGDTYFFAKVRVPYRVTRTGC